MIQIFVTTNIILCLLLLHQTNGAPLEMSKYPADTIEFMKKFGYLEQDDGNSEALYTEEGISDIIKTMQKFGAIEQTGLIDNATIKLMSTPRCGVPDIIRHKRQKRFHLGSNGWNKRHITYFVANWSPKLGEHAVVKNIQLALDAWGKYGRLNFHRAPTPDADIIVAFGRGHHGDTFPFDGPGNILAHAFFPYEYQGLGGDIHFDDDENWTDRHNGGSEKGTDFFTVALHELGHSLGLAHSSVPNSIMFPYYRGYDESGQFKLDYDDILGMYQLYISRRLEDDDKTSSIDDDYDSETTTPNEKPSTTTIYEQTTTTTRRTTEFSRQPTYATPFAPSGRTTIEDEQPTLAPRGRTTIEDDQPTDRGTGRSTRHFDSTTPSISSTVTYVGDSESVDQHKNHDVYHNIPKTNSPSLPNICDAHFDSVATLRGELFIFKDQYIWRLKDRGRIAPGYPVPLRQMFAKLPKIITKIDAAYERPDGMIIFFTGKDFWVYDGSNFIENSPKSISYYGLPNTLNSVDAVQVWGRNGKTYFYKQDRFWRYNETAKAMDPGYPQHMEKWRRIPENIDAATTWRDGSTYFFKGDLFWKFDNNWVIATDESPLPTSQVWLGCPEDYRMSRMFGV